MGTQLNKLPKEGTEDIFLGEAKYKNRLFNLLSANTPSVHSVGIVTAENPMGEELSDDENKERNNKLKIFMGANNYGFKQIFGRFGIIENPFFVPNISKSDLLKLGNMYNQECVIFGTLKKTDRRNIKENHMIFEYIELSFPNAVNSRDVFVLFNVDEKQFIIDYYSESKGKRFIIPIFDEEFEIIKNKPDAYHSTSRADYMKRRKCEFDESEIIFKPLQIENQNDDDDVIIPFCFYKLADKELLKVESQINGLKNSSNHVDYILNEERWLKQKYQTLAPTKHRLKEIYKILDIKPEYRLEF